jgi:DNA-binding HxlR family transcriptional regulator
MRIGRELARGPQRFSDLLATIEHCDALNRVLRKLLSDGLAMKRNDGLYTLSPLGRQWIDAALPLLSWTEAHPRNPQPPRSTGNDPVFPVHHD